ncbi:hypothetical protein [Burkholderia ubonensis]|uniref:hypothetical protein n=1 Tax=Burkholderia ubonensis TaxID=101571 RepID=UPI000A4F4CAB|nr:hypothetical protein [Burkholderia ubonensis]
MALPELAGWQLESMRASFFANTPIVARDLNWWQALTNHTPEAVVSQPNAGVHSESGEFGAGRLEMKVTFNRVDWLYTPITTPGPNVPSLGSAEELISSFTEPLSTWLASSSEVAFQRIAFGPALLRQVANVVEGNRAVLAYMPHGGVDPELARDLFFQVNYPRRSNSFDEVTINRLSKFMCATIQYIKIDIGSPLPSFDSLFFCRSELDFNTTADRQQPIPPEKRAGIYEEMVACAIEMISTGVRP